MTSRLFDTKLRRELRRTSASLLVRELDMVTSAPLEQVSLEGGRTRSISDSRRKISARASQDGDVNVVARGHLAHQT